MSTPTTDPHAMPDGVFHWNPKHQKTCMARLRPGQSIPLPKDWGWKPLEFRPFDLGTLNPTAVQRMQAAGMLAAQHLQDLPEQAEAWREATSTVLVRDSSNHYSDHAFCQKFARWLAMGTIERTGIEGALSIITTVTESAANEKEAIFDAHWMVGSMRFLLLQKLASLDERECASLAPAIQRLFSAPARSWCRVHLADTADEFFAACEQVYPVPTGDASVHLLAIKQFGVEAFPWLDRTLQQCVSIYGSEFAKGELPKAKRALNVWTDFHHPHLLQSLLKYPDELIIQEHIIICLQRWPLYTLQKLLEVTSPHSSIERILVNALNANPDLLPLLQASASAAQSSSMERIAKQVTVSVPAPSSPMAGEAATTNEEAPPSDLPDLLSEPPWLSAGKPTAAEKASKPWLKIPAKMPELPLSLHPSQLPAPVLRESGATVDATAFTHLLRMLMLCKLEHPYPGLAQILPAFTPDSLFKLADALWDRWESANHATDLKWMFLAQAWLGDARTVSRLCDEIANWPSMMAFPRAKLGLAVLADMGGFQNSDAALRALIAFGEKGKPSLREPARALAGSAATRMGLSPDELADRLVPDFGLNHESDFRFTLGARVFLLAFDESLTPTLLDEEGERLQDLPKAKVGEDPDGSETSRWKALKKEVKALAAQQLSRLETGWLRNRSWTLENFQSLFVRHPMLRSLGQRLLWSVDGQSNGSPAISFRLNEQWEPVDVDDRQIELQEDAQIRLAHPVVLQQDALDAWQRVWQDYRIVPPFQQLHRSVHVLTDAELAAAGDIPRLRGKHLPTGSIVGLLHADWQRRGDGAHVFGASRGLASGGVAVIELDPGYDIMSPGANLVQQIRRAGFTGATSAIERSEILRIWDNAITD